MTGNLAMAGVTALEAMSGDTAGAVAMDEDAFTAFYDRTARAIWAYLVHVTGDQHAADDLVQETYLRFLGVRRAWESEAHQRHYLFRIATNLARDRFRTAGREVALPDATHHSGDEPRDESGIGFERTAAVRQALARMSARERELLWLAYAEGATHEEIAASLGLRPRGIRVMLFRARRKMAALLGRLESDTRRRER